MFHENLESTVWKLHNGVPIELKTLKMIYIKDVL